MKTKAEVRKRIDQVVWKYFKLRLTKNFEQKVENCKFASCRKLENGSVTVHCRYGCPDNQPPKDICVYQHNAGECPVFSFRKTRAEIKQEYKQDLSRPLFKRHNMKDLVQLEWVAGLSEVEAAEVESRFLDEFLIYLKKRQESEKKVYYKVYTYLLGWFKKREAKKLKPNTEDTEDTELNRATQIPF